MYRLGPAAVEQRMLLDTARLRWYHRARWMPREA
jgi:hypothetical protein